MKWMDVEAQWPALQQRARRHWFHLTQDDVERITGAREELIDRVQERYRFSREEAEKEVDAWVFFLTAPDVTPSQVTTAPHAVSDEDASDDALIHDVMSHPDLPTEASTVPDDAAPDMAPDMAPNAAPEAA
jgi:uncharacterized protein YjbJ (UPF0337 family)